ncbi:hypothetical protein, partial [Pseudomonas sp.]|uniref:hypothetical protein n=1 Tax=Pseudomonas sp. TaxID=306 RepID=UPI003265E176
QNPCLLTQTGVLFWAVGKYYEESFVTVPLAAVRPSMKNPPSNIPLGKSIQSVSAFLVWCSTFSQGLIFHPQDAASTFFNEML